MMSGRRMKLPIILAAVLFGASVSLANAAPKKQHAHSHKVHTTHKAKHHAGKKSRRRRPRGQQAIDHERARQIQEALVREHYLSGEPSGAWDTATQHAMRRYQADQGWQTKVVPDSRALIRLGLGPSHDHLLNPESAMVTGPKTLHANAASSGAGDAGASPVLPGGSSTAVSAGPDLSTAQ